MLRVTDDNDRGFGSRGGIAVTIGQQVGQLRARDSCLIRDQRAGWHAGIDLQVELHDRRFTRVEHALASARRRWFQIRRAHRDTGLERKHTAVRLADGRSVERERVRNVCRVGRHRVDELGSRGWSRTIVVNRNRVAQHITRIDDARGSPVNLQRSRLRRK